MTSRKDHKKRRMHTGGSHEGSWAVSYVDMLTVVLCFFIVFFNSDKAKVNNTLKSLQQIRAEIGGKNLSCDGDGSGAECRGGKLANIGTGAATTGDRAPSSESGMGAALSRGIGSGGGSGNGAGPGAGTESGSGQGGVGSGNAGGVATGSSMGKIFQNLTAQPRLNTQSGFKDDILEIEFNKVSFFESGSKELTAEGRQTIEQVMKVLKPYKENIRITVQGHTDSKAVVHSRKNAADNWELSVIRATSVLKMFKTEGFPQSQLSAEGFADTKPERDLATAKSKEDLAKQRRITLRVEELKHEK